ncbi:hypothetical protein [Erwinia pyrifoliae]|uniref:hypothetical protein n=1 Tax=Erwinia pyrifoliae TaxID=79967 RepID=UPI00223AFB30|nr:hypothetical protein [Erwinia pyrifoliae]MCT2388872.1 hypothetical protein [Erwinia pyrifoliae]MCU8589066.1 hypothetical protein [Erwinia pyrifoliae]
MRKFISAATGFFFLNEGEILKSSDLYGNVGHIYVTWPDGAIWRVKLWNYTEWESITDDTFLTENAAFNFAYQHFLQAK